MLVENFNEIQEITDNNYLVLFVSLTMIPNKTGKECSFVEYICKNKYKYYEIKNDKKKNYAIVFEKNKLNKNDLLNICALIEYRESLYSFDDVDIFSVIRDLDDIIWKECVGSFDDKIKQLQETSIPFGTKEYDSWQNKLSLYVFIKYICTEGFEVEKSYNPLNDFSYLFQNQINNRSTKSEEIVNNYLLYLLTKEANVRLYLSDKVPYKLIKNELLRFDKKEYVEYLNKIKNIRNEFYVKNNIYIVKYVSEWDLYKLVKENYKSAIFQYSPPFLNRQRYDIYIPQLKLAIEYQGQQHYEQTDFFGPLEEIQERDKKKKKLSDENGVNIIYWKYDEKINKKNLDDKIKEYLI